MFYTFQGIFVFIAISILSFFCYFDCIECALAILKCFFSSNEFSGYCNKCNWIGMRIKYQTIWSLWVWKMSWQNMTIRMSEWETGLIQYWFSLFRNISYFWRRKLKTELFKWSATVENDNYSDRKYVIFKIWQLRKMINLLFDYRPKKIMKISNCVVRVFFSFLRFFSIIVYFVRTLTDCLYLLSWSSAGPRADIFQLFFFFRFAFTST